MAVLILLQIMCPGYFEVVWHLTVLIGLQDEMFTYPSHSAKCFAFMMHPLLKAFLEIVTSSRGRVDKGCSQAQAGWGKQTTDNGAM